jgi:hypothetical protein
MNSMQDLKKQVLDRLDIAGFYQKELPSLKNGQGDEATAFCPFHDDQNTPNLSVNQKNGLFHCFACGAQGSVFDFYMRRHGVEFKEALTALGQLAGVEMDRSNSNRHFQGKFLSLSLRDFALQKRLPEEFLKAQGVKETRFPDGVLATDFHYLDAAGKLKAVRHRFANNDEKKFRYRKGDKALLYGLQKLAKIKETGWCLLVEGETDSLTCWLHCLPALGIPGKKTWRRVRGKNALEILQAVQVFLWEEPDAGVRSPKNPHEVLLREEVAKDLPHLLVIPAPKDFKDLSEAHCHGEDVKALVAELKKKARPVVPEPREAPKAPPQTASSKFLNPQAATAQAKAIPQVQFVSGRELEALSFPDPVWIIPNTLGEGYIILAGRPKLGKSWLGLCIAVAVATGGFALGKAELRATQGEVLYLGLEDKLRRLQKRLRKILGDCPFPDDLIIAENWPRLDKGGLEALQDFLKEHDNCRLVVIDTLAKVRPPRKKNSDPYEHDMLLGGALQSLAHQFSVSLLVVTHTRKNEAEDALDEVTGTTGITGSADAIMVLKRGRGKSDGTLTLAGRDIEEQALALKFHPDEGIWELMGDAAEYAMSQQRQEILKVLRENGPRTIKEVSEIIDKKYANVKRLLLKMANQQEVKSINGKYEIIQK